MKQLFLLIVLMAIIFPLKSQVVGGDNVFEFINLPSSARITALGDNLITVRDDDVNLAFSNPSLLNPSMSGQIAFSHNFHLSGIQNGYVAYGQHIDKWKTTLHGGLQYTSYGDFKSTDDIGNITGDFKAAEYAFVLGAGRELYERVSVGANLKFITSQFESYNSLGLVGDLAAVFHDTSNSLNITLLFKNIGGQLSYYTPENREPVPFEMQAGISKRLRYLPFRISIIYRYLNRGNIVYDDPNNQETNFFFDETPTADNNFVDNLARHFIFNGEFLFGKKDNFRVRFGYNHLRRKELTVKNLRSLSGFSMGIGLKINRFRIDYGRSIYSLGAGLNHLSISTNIKEFTKKSPVDF